MLSCYTVLDLTDERGEIGPMLLGDMGAQVIRVEPPEGSRARCAPPHMANGDAASLQFQAYNRNKASIVLDPDDPAEIADCIIRFFSDSERRQQLAAAARQSRGQCSGARNFDTRATGSRHS